MSISTAIPQIPTSRLLASIAAESAALAHQLGLLPDNASIETAGSATAVAGKGLTFQAFSGPIDFPDDYPADWQ